MKRFLRFLKVSITVTAVPIQWARRTVSDWAVTLQVESPLKDSILSYYGKGSELSGFGQETLKVLVWNIKKGELDDFCDDFRVLGQDKDLVLLQEGATAPPVLEALEFCGHLSWVMAHNLRYKKRAKGRAGVMIGSRAMSLGDSYLQSPINELFADTPKMILVSQYSLLPQVESDGSPDGGQRDPNQSRGPLNPKVSHKQNHKVNDDLNPKQNHKLNHRLNHKLTVINVHALVSRGFEGFLLQMDQLRLCLKDIQGPLLLAGDFNTWSQDKTNFILELTASQELSCLEFQPDRRTRSVNGYVIDWVFYRGMTLADAQTLDIKSSDHNAMVFSMKISQ